MSQPPPPPPPGGSPYQGPPSYQGGPPMYPPNVPPFGPGGYGPPGYSLPSQSRTSGAAIASLICGLVLCIPVFTGLAAIITGFIGIAQASKPAVKGRGMAIAGLLLGIFNFVLWGGGSYAIYASSAPARAFAHQYISDLNAGNIDQCMQNTASTSKLTHDQLDGEYKKMQGWGTLQNTLVFGFNVNTQNGNTSAAVSGSCTFSSGQHSFFMALTKENGQYKVTEFGWQN